MELTTDMTCVIVCCLFRYLSEAEMSNDDMDAITPAKPAKAARTTKPKVAPKSEDDDDQGKFWLDQCAFLRLFHRCNLTRHSSRP